MKTILMLLFVSNVSLASAHETEVRKVAWYNPGQQCNVVPSGFPSANGSYTFYLPPDVPDPVCISEFMIDSEQQLPTDLLWTYGPWFAAIDPGQTYLNCSHYPGAQDCPTIPGGPGGNQFGNLRNLGAMRIDPGTAPVATFNHNPPMCYHRGDAILINTPCMTADHSTAKTVNPSASFGLIYPKYTPTTACDTNTKLLLHGGSFPDPASGAPLANFISDSSPAWHAMASIPLGGSTSNVTIDKTVSTIGQPSSVKFDGNTNAMIWANASQDFRVGAGDFTIEMWFRPGNITAPFQQLFALSGGYAAYNLGQIGTHLSFSASSNGTSWTLSAPSWGSLAIGTWTHLVVQRAGNSVLLSQDGALIQTVAVSGALFDTPRMPLYIGNTALGIYPVTGNMQEVRLSKMARFPTGSYTVPTAPYPCP